MAGKRIQYVLICVISQFYLFAYGGSINGGHSADFLKRIRRGVANCGETKYMEAEFAYDFQTPNFGGGQYPADSQCFWNYIGTPQCIPKLECSKVDLRANDDCSEEFFSVSDGLGGKESFCGSKPWGKKALKPGKGYELFIDFDAKPGDFDRAYAGVSCKVICTKDGGGAKALEQTETNKEEFRCVCGLQNKEDRIVGGEDAKKNEFPWQAAIVLKGTRQPICGGSLIADNVILTAAHCFALDGTRPKNIDVLLKAHILDFTKLEGWKDVELGQEGSIRGRGHDAKQLSDDEDGAMRFEVEEMWNHPLFTPAYDFDYAVLKLKKRVNLKANDAPTPICLPPYDRYKDTHEGSVPTVSGWGKPAANAGSTTRLLQKLGVPVINLAKCQSWMPYTLTPRMVCAGFESGVKDACTGDSGGPLGLYVNATKQWTQIGIVSWGESCALAKRPGLYSNVNVGIPFIQYYAKLAGSKWCRNTK